MMDVISVVNQSLTPWKIPRSPYSERFFGRDGKKDGKVRKIFRSSNWIDSESLANPTPSLLSLSKNREQHICSLLLAGSSQLEPSLFEREKKKKGKTLEFNPSINPALLSIASPLPFPAQKESKDRATHLSPVLSPPRGKNYSVDESQSTTGQRDNMRREKERKREKKWRERRRGRGTLTLLARGISRNSKMNGTSILPRTRGQEARVEGVEGGRRPPLWNDTKKEKKERKKRKNETERIGSESKKSGEGSEVKTAAVFHGAGKERWMIEGWGEEGHECRVSVQTRPCSLVPPPPPPVPPRLFALFAWSARDRVECATPPSLHNTYTAECYPVNVRARPTYVPPPLIRCAASSLERETGETPPLPDRPFAVFLFLSLSLSLDSPRKLIRDLSNRIGIV